MKKQHVSSYLIYALCVLIFPSCSPEEGQLEIIPEAVNSGDSVVDNSARGTLSITSFSKDEEVGNDRVRSFRIAGGCVENTNLDVSIDSYSATTACQETGFYSFLVDLSSFENGIETVVISDGDNEVSQSFNRNVVSRIIGPSTDTEIGNANNNTITLVGQCDTNKSFELFVDSTSVQSFNCLNGEFSISQDFSSFSNGNINLSLRSGSYTSDTFTYQKRFYVLEILSPTRGQTFTNKRQNSVPITVNGTCIPAQGSLTVVLNSSQMSDSTDYSQTLNNEITLFASGVNCDSNGNFSHSFNMSSMSEFFSGIFNVIVSPGVHESNIDIIRNNNYKTTSARFIQKTSPALQVDYFDTDSLNRGGSDFTVTGDCNSALGNINFNDGSGSVAISCTGNRFSLTVTPTSNSSGILGTLIQGSYRSLFNYSYFDSSAFSPALQIWQRQADRTSTAGYRIDGESGSYTEIYPSLASAPGSNGAVSNLYQSSDCSGDALYTDSNEKGNESSGRFNMPVNINHRESVGETLNFSVRYIDPVASVDACFSTTYKYLGRPAIHEEQHTSGKRFKVDFLADTGVAPARSFTLDNYHNTNDNQGNKHIIGMLNNRIYFIYHKLSVYHSANVGFLYSQNINDSSLVDVSTSLKGSLDYLDDSGISNLDDNVNSYILGERYVVSLMSDNLSGNPIIIVDTDDHSGSILSDRAVGNIFYNKANDEVSFINQNSTSGNIIISSINSSGAVSSIFTNISLANKKLIYKDSSNIYLYENDVTNDTIHTYNISTGTTSTASVNADFDMNNSKMCGAYLLAKGTTSTDPGLKRLVRFNTSNDVIDFVSFANTSALSSNGITSGDPVSKYFDVANDIVVNYQATAQINPNLTSYRMNAYRYDCVNDIIANPSFTEANFFRVNIGTYPNRELFTNANFQHFVTDDGVYTQWTGISSSSQNWTFNILSTALSPVNQTNWGTIINNREPTSDGRVLTNIGR